MFLRNEWVNLPSEASCSREVLAEDKGYIEWVVQESFI